MQKLENQGLSFSTIADLQSRDKSSKLRGRFAGIVLRVPKDQRFVNFVVSDGTGTAEVTMVYKRVSKDLQLPEPGDSVEVVGKGYCKVLGGRNNPYKITKIFALGIGKISPLQEFQCQMIAIVNSEKYKKAMVLKRIPEAAKLEPQVRDRSFESQEERVSIRTIIFNFCYYIFEHNTDIQSYVFNAEMVRRNKQAQEFLKESRASRQCFEDAVLSVLREMVTMDVLRERAEPDKEPLFVVKRDLLKNIEKVFESRVQEMESQGGTNIQHLTAFVNRKIGQNLSVTMRLFEWQFSQTILTNLQDENKIYKTSDKLIYPNIRH